LLSACLVTPLIIPDVRSAAVLHGILNPLDVCLAKLLARFCKLVDSEAIFTAFGKVLNKGAALPESGTNQSGRPFSPFNILCITY